MQLSLENKVILITGSTSGIGKSIAASLAKEGAIVVVNGRSEAGVQAAVTSLKESTSSQKVYGIAADVSSQEGVDSLVAKLNALNLPPLYGLVNNTGIFESKPFGEIKDSEWHNFFDVNVMSGVRLSRTFLPQFLERNEGVILFIASEAAYCPKGFMVHYSMTKSAQLAISRGLSELTKGTKVRVDSVLPGPTWTEGVAEYINGIAKEKGVSAEQVSKEYFAETEPTSLLQRFATPEEVASVCAFMLSPVASAINGRSWLVDGGIVRSI